MKGRCSNWRKNTIKLSVECRPPRLTVLTLSRLLFDIQFNRLIFFSVKKSSWWTNYSKTRWNSWRTCLQDTKWCWISCSKASKVTWKYFKSSHGSFLWKTQVTLNYFIVFCILLLILILWSRFDDILCTGRSTMFDIICYLIMFLFWIFIVLTKCDNYAFSAKIVEINNVNITLHFIERFI